MNSNKRYTTQTFKKRLDHESNASLASSRSGTPAYCDKCGAIYTEKHWVARHFAHDSLKHSHWRPLKRTTCPACTQIREGIVGGYFVLTGKFLVKHRDEINGLITNEEHEAYRDNPLSRIMERRDDNGELIVETTTEHLAQRLGHAVKKAYDGEIEYDFSHENKVLRVHWERN